MGCQGSERDYHDRYSTISVSVTNNEYGMEGYGFLRGIPS